MPSSIATCPRGDCVQPRPSFTVVSSKVTLSIKYVAELCLQVSCCCEQNVFNLCWTKSLFIHLTSLLSKHTCRVSHHVHEQYASIPIFGVKCVNVASLWRVFGLYNIVRCLCMTTTDKRIEVEDLRQLLASRRAG